MVCVNNHRVNVIFHNDSLLMLTKIKSDASLIQDMNNLNEKLKYCLLGIYKKFVDEVDPKTILDFLIEKRVVTIEEREKIITCGTRQDKCRTMLDKFFTTSNPSAFVLLKEALQEHYSWLALELDEGSKQIQIGP